MYTYTNYDLFGETGLSSPGFRIPASSIKTKRFITAATVAATTPYNRGFLYLGFTILENETT